MPLRGRLFVVLAIGPWFLQGLLWGGSPADQASVARAEDLEFNRDIRPILSDKCYQCHGPDAQQRQAGLRLDSRESALHELDSGATAIVPGDVERSELVVRIRSEDGDVRMPPPTSHKQLTESEAAKLQQWIASGASWGDHWSFVPPRRSRPPNHPWPKRAVNPIDDFVFAKLAQLGLTPRGPASPRELIRRVSFDLTGMPPSPDEVDAFLNDASPLAFERLVDRLLASPRFGEHLARYWLDAARYGDTHGLHLDNERSLWPYRQWVIDAFNRNMPFDQFAMEQMAGDLLPDATLSQRIATGFHRCNVTTSEGGAIDEEWRVRYAIDRVETTATVFLGLTAGCTVCHDHKFDPLSQREFYQLFAYFGSVDEKPMDGNALLPPPIVKVPSDEQRRQQELLSERIAAVQGQIQEALAAVVYEDPGGDLPTHRGDYIWLEDAEFPANANPDAGWKFITASEGPVFSGSHAHLREAPGRSQHLFTGASPGLRIGEDDRFFAHVYLDPDHPPREIMLQFHDGAWEHRAYWGESLIDWGQEGSVSRKRIGDLPEVGKWTRLEFAAADVGLAPGAILNGVAFTQFDGKVYWDQLGLNTMTPQGDAGFASLAAWRALQLSLDKPDLPGPVLQALKAEPDQQSPEQQKQIRDYFLEHVCTSTRAVFDPLHADLADLRTQLQAVQQAVPATMVMKDKPQPTPTYVLVRGQYDQPDQEQQVHPNVPAALPPLPDDAPSNRLGLANWLVSERNPLTARVTVNRYWQHVFGVGIVKTSEDFGSQGEWPSHPELLDWLATEFRESGWNIKHMFRLMVVSAVYRQSAQVTPEALAIDPRNRHLSRGPRFRLDAEALRDQALTVSGLLVESNGGKSVKPYQPAGLWKAVGYSGSNTVRFSRDDGDKLFRRSLYTFWKRTSPPPGMTTLDAPSRESCTVRRERTNTPLQALLLMNDEQFFEAARFMAQRVLLHVAPDDKRLDYAFQLAVCRPPRDQERKLIAGLAQRYLKEFRQSPERAEKVLQVGVAGFDPRCEPAELAAWTVICNLILNLDEVLTK